MKQNDLLGHVIEWGAKKETTRKKEPNKNQKQIVCSVCVCVFIYIKVLFVWNFVDLWYVLVVVIFSHLPLLHKFALLLDLVQLFSRTAKLFDNFPFALWLMLFKSALLFAGCLYGHSVADVVGLIDASAVVIAESASKSGSPFRFTTFISTSTPWSFDATDCSPIFCDKQLFPHTKKRRRRIYCSIPGEIANARPAIDNKTVVNRVWVGPNTKWNHESIQCVRACASPAIKYTRSGWARKCHVEWKRTGEKERRKWNEKNAAKMNRISETKTNNYSVQTTLFMDGCACASVYILIISFQMNGK